MSIKEIKASDLPKEVKDALKELADQLGDAADKADTRQQFKEELGHLMSTAIIENEVSPNAACAELMVMAAILVRVYLAPKKGSDERKSFKRMAGRAYDRAHEIGNKVAEQEQE